MFFATKLSLIVFICRIFAVLHLICIENHSNTSRSNAHVSRRNAIVINRNAKTSRSNLNANLITIKLKSMGTRPKSSEAATLLFYREKL